MSKVSKADLDEGERASKQAREGRRAKTKFWSWFVTHRPQLMRHGFCAPLCGYEASCKLAPNCEGSHYMSKFGDFSLCDNVLSIWAVFQAHININVETVSVACQFLLFLIFTKYFLSSTI